MKTKFTLLLFISFILSAASLSAQVKNLIFNNLTIADLPIHEFFNYPNAVQTKYVQIDFSKLDEESIFRLDFFQNQSIEFSHAASYEYGVGSSSWVGKNLHGNGDLIFSFYKGYISGILTDDNNKKYILQQINQSDYFGITEVAIESMQESASNTPDYILPDAALGKKTRANADVCAAGNTCAGPSTIDLMVLGTAAAITNGGGTVGSFTSNVTSAVTEMNTAYANSGGTNLTFNLVHCDATAIVSTIDMSADLSDFAANAGVQALRNTYYADLVSLWAGSGSYAGFCGLGYLNTNPTNYSANSAYTVTDYGCGMTNLSYAHECGHNMGLRHDYYVDGSTSPCSHHHGYVNQTVIPSGTPSAARWRTIMAYNNHCSDNGFNCSRIARWSNPTLNISGDATGRAIGISNPSYEIYGFQRFACVVSQFRVSPLPIEWYYYKAKAAGDKIKVEWQTVNEVNNKGFEIEMRKSASEDFKMMGFVKATTSKSIQHDYSFDITNLLAGTYYVRIIQVDIDNHSMYTDVQKVVLGSSAFQSAIYPNPAKESFTVSLYNPKSQEINISLYDILGNKISTIYHQFSAEGQIEINTSTASLAKGMYFCTISSNNEQYVSKFVVE